MIVATDKNITIEHHKRHVRIFFEGQCLADTDRSLLLIESCAPDIYIPFEDIDMSLLEKTDSTAHCPAKGEASYWSIRAGESKANDAMWAYECPLQAFLKLNGHVAFNFNQVDTFVDGKLVRGHVRDPNKVIRTEPKVAHLQMELGGETIVNSNSWVMLYETGLPARHYVPVSDVNVEYLVPSERQTVCTYKGEAVYHNIQLANRVQENVVWSYPDPWLDFSTDVSRIKGLFGLYCTAFDRVIVDGELLERDEITSRADAAMQSAPTIDSTLAAKLK